MPTDRPVFRKIDDSIPENPPDRLYSRQAERVINKFGGARNLYRAILELGMVHEFRSPATIYRWTYPRTKNGTGGFIPSSALPIIQLAARKQGILLTPEDLLP